MRGDSLLTSRRLPLAAALIAMLLSLPALWVGFQTDDYVQRAILLQRERPGIAAAAPDLPQSKLDLFSFLDGDPARNRRWMDKGLLPWWSDPRLRVAFWRPATAVTHIADYWLWPERAWLMHLHSSAWFGALVGAAAVLYRRIMGAGLAAGLAAALYAVDDAHGFSVGWLANRNALVATTFGILTLLAHDWWRRPPAGSFTQKRGYPGRRTLAAITGSICFALTLLAGEMGAGVVGYLFAYAVFIDRSSWPKRLGSLVPYVLVGAIWAALHHAGGYGASGSGMYTDPVGEPWHFVWDVLRRGPMLLLAQMAFPPAESHVFMSVAAERWLVGAGFVFSVLMVVVLWPLRKNRTARFWACGMVLALLPACASMPQDRLLFFVGIGAMGLIGQYIARARVDMPGEFLEGSESRTASNDKSAAPLIGGFLVVTHLLIAPIMLPIRSYSAAMMGRSFERAADSIGSDARLDRQRLVIVNATSGYLTSLIRPIRMMRGQNSPDTIWLLSAGIHRVEVERTDPRTLIVRPARGFLAGSGESEVDELSAVRVGEAGDPWINKHYLHNHVNRLFRSANTSFRAGERIELTGMTVEVLRVSGTGQPMEALFRFEVPLEDGSLRWMRWEGDVLAPFTPPGVGERVTIPGVVPF